MDTPSRRQVLVGGATAGSVAAAGALGLLDWVPFLSGQANSGPTLGPVPADANLLIRGDAETLRDDDGLRAVVSGGIDARSGEGQRPNDVDGLFRATDTGWGLDPSGITDATAFARVDRKSVGDSMVGAVLAADWDPDDIAADIDATAYTTTSRTVRGRTVHTVEGPGTEVTALGDGRFAVGINEAVPSVLAITEGDADRLSGDLRAAFGETPTDRVRFAAAMPPLTDGIAGLLPFQGELLKEEILGDLQYLRGSVYAEGDERGIGVTVTAVDENAATRFETQLVGALALFEERAPETASLPGAIDSVSVETVDARVEVTFSGPVDRLTDLSPVVVDWLVGTGGLIVPTDGLESDS